MSQAELARLIGIKQPSLWEIEHNKTKSLKGATLAKLCDVLHTTPDFLLNEIPDDAGLELAMMASELLHALRALPAAGRQELIDFARFQMGKQGASSSSPFGKAVAGTETAAKTTKPRRGVSVFGDLDELPQPTQKSK